MSLGIKPFFVFYLNFEESMLIQKVFNKLRNKFSLMPIVCLISQGRPPTPKDVPQPQPGIKWLDISYLKDKRYTEISGDER